MKPLTLYTAIPLCLLFSLQTGCFGPDPQAPKLPYKMNYVDAWTAHAQSRRCERGDFNGRPITNIGFGIGGLYESDYPDGGGKIYTVYQGYTEEEDPITVGTITTQNISENLLQYDFYVDTSNNIVKCIPSVTLLSKRHNILSGGLEELQKKMNQ